MIGDCPSPASLGGCHGDPCPMTTTVLADSAKAMTTTAIRSGMPRIVASDPTSPGANNLLNPVTAMSTGGEMTILAKPSVAVGFGAFMLCAETCDHWTEIAHLNWLSMPLYDWTAAFLLIAVAMVHRQDFQATAWAFMLSLLFGAFFGHLESWLGPPG